MKTAIFVEPMGTLIPRNIIGDSEITFGFLTPQILAENMRGLRFLKTSVDMEMPTGDATFILISTWSTDSYLVGLISHACLEKEIVFKDNLKANSSSFKARMLNWLAIHEDYDDFIIVTGDIDKFSMIDHKNLFLVDDKIGITSESAFNFMNHR